METQLMTLNSRAPVLQVPEFSDLVANFLLSLDVKPATVYYYQRCLKQYIDYLTTERIDPVQVQREDLIQYKRALIESGRGSLTVAAYLQVCKSLYSWISDEFGTRNLARNIKAPTRIKKFRRQPLTPLQATQLLEYFSQGNLRDFAIVNILIRCGLRTIELSRLDISDVVYKGEQRVLMVQGKGHIEKDSFVVLSPKCNEVISEYLKTKRGVLTKSPLFTSVAKKNYGGRICTYTISRIVKSGLREIGIDSPEYSCHSLRHTCGTAILRAGGSMEQAQNVLRHMSSETTKIYTSVFADEQRLSDPAEFLIDQLF